MALSSFQLYDAARGLHSRSWVPLLATFSLISAQCDLTAGPGQMSGEVTATSCVEYIAVDMTVGRCALLCHFQVECFVAYTNSDDGVFRCILCEGVEAIDFTAVHENFYLGGRVLLENHGSVPSHRLSLAGGLSVGQVMVVKFVMWSDRTFFLLIQTNGHYAMLVEFRLYSRAIVRNSKLGWWGHEERSKPHFNFVAGQEVEIVYIVRQNDYMIYIDKLPFFTFQHRVTDLESIQYFEFAGSGSGGNLKSFSITS
ncbi:hypothetical protein RRG08_033409 [Elysia crispata]|uniref:Galectin n=1 Tax=Elysia crispata TaxID=231223 RepID=A0AAE0XYL2_9GAST|nr:hypothetical protein RRG08_033409 [Elysia crispata]